MARVFLSSRFQELEDTRRHLVRVFRDVEGVELIALDDGSAAPVGALERSLDAVRSADVVVLLCGRTYLDDGDERELSVTHLEVRAALASGRTRLLAYAVDDPGRDPRVDALLAEVAASGTSTYGRLTGNPYDDADRVLNDYQLWFSDFGGDEVDGGQSPAAMVLADLARLGVRGLDSWSMPAARAALEPTYTQLAEQRRLAAAALARDETEVAIEFLGKAHDAYPLDWCTDYVLARLLERRGRRGDLERARSIARQAAKGVTDVDHAPSPRDADEDVVTRREAATAVLRARLARVHGDPARAADLAARSVELAPTSREALIELVLARALLQDQQRTAEAAAMLLRVHPDRAARLMRAQELAPVQPGVESHVVALVHERHAQIRAQLGLVPPGRPPQRLRDALAAFRSTAEAAQAALAVETSAVATLFTVPDPTGVSQPRWSAFTSAHAELERHQVELRRRRDALAEEHAALRRQADDEEDAYDERLADQAAAARGRLERGAARVAAIEGLRPVRLAGSGPYAIAAVFFWPGVVSVVHDVLEPALPMSTVRAVALALLGLGVVFVLAAGVAVVRTGRRRAQLRRARAATASAEASCQRIAEEQGRRARRAEVVAGLAELDGELAGASETGSFAVAAAGSAAAEAAEVAVQLGADPDGGLTGVVEALHKRYLAFNRAFASFPNWGFTTYVPAQRARPGDLTRVEGHSPWSGGWLAKDGAGAKRLVRLVDGGEVSDVGAVVEVGDHLAALERALASVVEDAARSQADLPDQRDPTSDLTGVR